MRQGGRHPSFRRYRQRFEKVVPSPLTVAPDNTGAFLLTNRNACGIKCHFKKGVNMHAIDFLIGFTFGMLFMSAVFALRFYALKKWPDLMDEPHDF